MLTLLIACPCFSAKSLTLTFFRLTSVTKNIFYKINRLTWRDAVFTVRRPVYCCIFLVSGVISLGRTVSAQFKLKVRFCIFLTDPPYVSRTLDAISRRIKMDWRIPSYAGDMCASPRINENLRTLKIKQPQQRVWKSSDFFLVDPPCEKYFF